MARIPEGELDRIKREVSLEDLAKSSGVELVKKGRDLVGLCPFHDDKTPSLVITPDKNLWNCLGACREGGSVIDWVMKRDHVSFRHAVEILKQQLPGEGASLGEFRFHSSMTEAELLATYTRLCHRELGESQRCLEYLRKRGLEDPGMIDTFKLGFSDRKLGYLLPSRDSKEGREIRKKLISAGVCRSSGHEHLSGSLVIPIFDETGRITEMYGRKIAGNLMAQIPRHLYLPGPHQGVFNILSIPSSKEIILCESLIDALTFYRHGFHNVTSSYGINGFTDDILQAFKTYGINRVFIAYDADEAGDKAAIALAQRLVKEGMDVFRIRFPKGHDANSFAVRSQHPGEDLKHLIEGAEWLGQALMGGYKKTAAIAAKEKESGSGEGAGSGSGPVGTVLEQNFERKGEDIFFTFDDRRWRVRGMARNLSYELLKINLLIGHGESFHVDSFDLYSARHRHLYTKQAAKELGLSEDLIKGDLGKVLLSLEGIQQEEIEGRLKKKNQPKTHEMSSEEEEEALGLLKSPNLLDKVLKDFYTCGVVGERTNKLVGYLAAISRKLDTPLAIIIQSSSSAGKTWLMESILSLVPLEERIKYSAMTGQSLFYLGETDLKHKILAIVEEEGAEKASYALKLLQSEGELSIASTGKDPQTGRLVTQEYRVEGPVMIFVTTTNIDIDEELQNRCIILTVDESREQTRAIHRLQREKRTLEGLKRAERKPFIKTLHQNAQRLLKPLKVLNPYARELTFLDDKTRTRRDHEKYLCLIDSIAFLHQYQREIRKDGGMEYIVVDLKDIEMANSLAHEVLGRSLDELPPQTRNLLLQLDRMVTERCLDLHLSRSDVHFSRRQVIDYVHWSLTQIRIHLARLVDLEYLIVHRGNRGRTFSYELLYNGEGQNGTPFLPGLIDVEKLKARREKPLYDVNLAGPLHGLAGSSHDLAGLSPNLEGPKRGQNGPKTGGWRVGKIGGNGHEKMLSLTLAAIALENARLGCEKKMTHRSEGMHP